MGREVQTAQTEMARATYNGESVNKSFSGLW